LPLTLLPLAAASSLAAATPLALLAGVAIAPAFAAMFALAERVAAAGALTEAFAWLTTAIAGGASLGAAAAGALVGPLGVHATILAATGVVALGAAVAAARRETLQSTSSASVGAKSSVRTGTPSGETTPS